MDALKYEMFIRNAFELATGKRVERFEDPAAFADTDTFSAGNLPVVKAATGYAMGIYQNNIKGKVGISEACDNLIADVVAATDLKAISGLIKKFSDEIIDTCFDRDREDGKLTAKE